MRLYQIKLDDGTPDGLLPTTTGGELVLKAPPAGGGGSGETVWTAPATLSNGWVNYGAPYAPAGYRRDGSGYVHLRGLIKNGTMQAATGAFTLPVGYRPSYDLLLPAICGAYADVKVSAAGVVAPNHGSNGYFSLEGVTFLAEA